MNITDLRFRLVELRRDGVSIDRVELTETALDDIHSSVQAEAKTDSTTGLPGGAVDVVVGDTNQVITENGDTYDL